MYNEEAEPQSGVDTRRCDNKDAGPRRGWIGGSHFDWRNEMSVSEDAEIRREWIVRFHIDWRGKQNILCRVRR